jgi:sigma-E factor negative regulatory protein RseA
VTQEQVESQLSAMFDGELPAAECELLSRRIDRDENLRARWSRYALIGAAMRSEPVATARHGFASRVSAALEVSDRKVPAKLVHNKLVHKRTLWNTALAASMVAAVAGVSISTLRYSTPNAAISVGAGTTAPANAAVGISAPSAVSIGVSKVNASVNASTDAGVLRPVSTRVVRNNGSGEPLSYVTPTNSITSGVGLRTDLADFIVAHSEYSTPLMRRYMLTELVSNEESSEVPASYASAAGAGQINAAPAASAASH